jgi:hypothetical protein
MRQRLVAGGGDGFGVLLTSGFDELKHSHDETHPNRVSSLQRFVSTTVPDGKPKRSNLDGSGRHGSHRPGSRRCCSLGRWQSRH